MQDQGTRFFYKSFFCNVSTECLPFFKDTEVTFSFFVFFLVTNFAVGLPANLCTVWSIWGGPTEVLLADIHHLSLAVCELLYCVALPLQLCCVIACTFTDWSLPHQLYSLGTLQIGLVWIGRPVFQSCICVERYVAVVHPLVYIRLRRQRNKVAGCVLSWSTFLLILFTRIFIPQRPEDGLVWVFLTLSLFLYCCLSVLFSLQRNPVGDRDRKEETSGVRMKKRAFNIILVHLLCFWVNFLPIFILFFFVSDKATYNAYHVLDGLGVVCGLIHPILYIHRAGKFSSVRKWF